MLYFSLSVFLSPVSPAWLLSRDYFLLHLCRTSHLASSLAFWGLKGLVFYSADKKKPQKTDIDNEPSALSAFKPREKLDSEPSIPWIFEPIDQLSQGSGLQWWEGKGIGSEVPW